MRFTRSITDLDWRFLLVVFSSLSLLIFCSLSTDRFSGPALERSFRNDSVNPAPSANRSETQVNVAAAATALGEWKWKEELDRSRIAVCLVGAARRFELTGDSIVKRILKVYPNSDLFLNSPIGRNSYKLSLLKSAPRIASVRIFEPKPILETELRVRVLTADGSPNGIQGLLQYFNLVEGCITIITDHETRNNFTYDWIIRTRVDGYWSAPLDPGNFVRGHYIVPPGSTYGGLNDRFGIGDRNTSIIALSRLSLIPKLNSAGFHQLNSETAFKAQLTTLRVPYATKSQPFCIVTDRKYSFPPGRFGVPVASMSSGGPLSGAKCRPCRPVCVGPCVGRVMSRLEKGWSWIESGNGTTTTTLGLCDAHEEWEAGWERVFDRVVGPELAESRRRVGRLNVEDCVRDFEEMKRKAAHWETPPVDGICKLGLDPETT
ncbi:hypothetical protein Dimus_023588 [Dionaea muscipula]